MSSAAVAVSEEQELHYPSPDGLPALGQLQGGPTIHGYGSGGQTILPVDILLLLLVGLCGGAGGAPKSGWAADVQT